MSRFIRSVVLVGFVLTAAVACTKKPAEPDRPLTPEETQAKLVDKGQRAYMAYCVACHNPDPRKDGVIGPAVADSSLDLLRLRVLEGKYPEGYKPKRTTNAMAPLPHLKAEIEALHAYLNSTKPK